MVESQFFKVIEWQNKTFGEATALSKICHLKDEIIELEDDLKGNNPDKRLEFADCFILLFGAAASDGMSFYDVCNAVKEKMEINEKRKWGKPDKNGVVNHIKS